MHDRAVVIGSRIVSVRYMLGKVTLAPGDYIRPVNSNKGIAVFAALLVPEAHGMTYLMDGITRSTTGAKLDELITAHASDVGPATGAGLKLYIVRVHRLICRSSKNKTNPCVGLPMRDSIGYTGLIGKSAVYCIRNDAVGPPLGSQYHNTCGNLSAYLSATQLCIALNLLDGTKDDIALKHCVTVNFTVLNLLGIKGLTVDKRSTQPVGLILLSTLATVFFFTFFSHSSLLNNIIPVLVRGTTARKDKPHQEACKAPYLIYFLEDEGKTKKGTTQATNTYTIFI